MKFSLVALLLLGGALPSVHALDLDYSGQFRLRNQNREFTFSNADRRNLLQLRARVSVNAKISDKLSFNFTPQATKNYGEVIATSNDENDSTRLSSGDQYHSGVDIFEAYVMSQEKGWAYKLGRQTLNYGDNLILGTRNWTNGGLVFDAAKLSFDIGSGQLDVAYAKISEGSDASNTTDDADLAFLYYKILQDKKMNLDLYVIHNNERHVLESYSYGFRIKGSWNNFLYRTENLIQSQKQRHETEHNIELEVGYKLPQNIKTYVGWLQASNNFDQLYTNRHKYNGIIDIVGRRNVESLFAGIDYKASDKWKLGFKWMNFKQKDLGFGAYNQAVSTTLAGNTALESIGNEFDLLVSYQKSKWEQLKLGASLFSHGDYFTGNPDDSTFIYLEYLLRI